jgi:hypothetical protein
MKKQTEKLTLKKNTIKTFASRVQTGVKAGASGYLCPQTGISRCVQCTQ